MKITKKHKLYFRDGQLVIRRLDKLVPMIYLHILKLFIEGDANNRYLELNKNVRHWSNYKPIPIELPKEFENSFKVLIKTIGNPYLDKVIISYNGSWQPLVELTLQSEV